MICTVYLVRHGSTTLSAEDRFAGSTDVPLGTDGELQAELLGKRLKRTTISAVYCSPMKRTVRTAELINQSLGLEIKTCDGIKEVDHGRWEGKTRYQVANEFKESYQAYEQDPFTAAPEDGESGLQVLARALPAFQEIVSKHPGQSIVIVSHKATIRLLISYFLGFDLRRYRDVLDQQPCCLNVLDFKLKPFSARLKLFNDTTHYDDLKCQQVGVSRISDFYDIK